MRGQRTGTRERSCALRCALAMTVLVAGQALGQATAPKTELSGMPQMARWMEFNSRAGNRWRVQWNEVTGTPRRISGYYLELPEPVTRATVESVTRRILGEHKDLLLVDTRNLVLRRADYDEPRLKQSSGTWYVTYGQVHRGVPVLGGAARVVIQSRRVTMFGADFYRGINVDTRPAISAEAAEAEASRHLGAGTQLKALSKERVVYPKVRNGRVSYHLAWKLTMPVSHELARERAGPGRLPANPPAGGTVVQWRYFVDAHTGEFLDRVNIFMQDVAGTAMGLVHDEGSAPGAMRPIRNLGVRLIEKPPSIPAPRPSRAFYYERSAGLLQVRPSTCPRHAVTNAAGRYEFRNVGCRDPILLSWLKGPYAEIINMSAIGPPPFHLAGSLGAVHNWSWEGDDHSPADVETSAFNHVNWIHDWFKRGAPFDVVPRPRPMPVHVEVPWNALRCNAGSAESGLYFAPTAAPSCSAMALCAGIVYHEYTHSVIEEIYRPIGGLVQFGGEAVAMHEGLADYFAQSVLDHPRVAQGCIGAGSRNIDTPDRRYPEHLEDEPHRDGLILAGALWDLRAQLGRDFVDGLAIRALKQMPLSFSEFLEALVLEDDNAGYQPGADDNAANGSPNAAAICDRFFELHGIYHAVCAGHTPRPTALIQQPSRIDAPALFRVGTTSIAVIGTAARSTPAALSGFVLEYAERASPATWLTAGMSLSGGGTAAVVDGLLGTWNVAAVPDGVYKLRLRVTDAAGTTASSEVDVVIDRWLRDGWPARDAFESASAAAIGELNATAPGMEAVVVSCDVMFFQANGTLYHRFRRAGGECYASPPALGDLDRDNVLDLVVATSTALAAYRNNGQGQFLDLFDPLRFAPGSGPWVGASPVLADLDGDGDLEIILGTQDGRLHLLHHDGSPFIAGGFTWPKQVGAIYATPAVADLDGDGRLDILVGSGDGFFYAWRLDGTNVPGWPVQVGRPIRASPVVGNIDGDGAGTLEVVVGAMDGQVHAWSATGSAISGWPVSVTPTRPVEAPAALGDLDGDGRLEVIVHGSSGPLQVFRHDGTAFAAWAPPALPLFDRHAPIVADLDGDASPEILIGPQGGRIYAMHANGALVAGFPRQTFASNGTDYMRTPVVANLDAQAQSELIVGGYVWNLPTTGNPARQEWPAFQHDMRRSGKY